MTVDSVSIKNFRNIPFQYFEADKEVNVIYGENAQGKTNILEAIWLFTGCKSFRNAKDDELIMFGEEKADTELTFSDKIRMKKAEIIYGEKKKVYLNEVELKSSSELAGNFYSVIFSPSHLSLIKDGPAVRRRFLDTALCQLKPKYSEYLRKYNRILLQRNAVLKDIGFNSELYDILDSWDYQLARYGAAVLNERLKYLNILSEYCQEIYAGISDNKEMLSVKYSLPQTENENLSFESLFLMEAEMIKKARKEDIINKTTSVGPHRDDMEILINGRSARSFGSQGQQRSAALSVKLGESEIIKSVTGEVPVALLDDVMSELDEKRQDYVLNKIKDRQVFITCCDPSQVMRLGKGKSFLIKNGSISE